MRIQEVSIAMMEGKDVCKNKLTIQCENSMRITNNHVLVILRAKWIRIKMDIEIEENFGYSPDSPRFDKLLEASISTRDDLERLGYSRWCLQDVRDIHRMNHYDISPKESFQPVESL